MKILVVDDEPRHRRGMERMIHSLRPEDQVFLAKDGANAIEIVKSEQPDVVLSDIRMPNMDGLSFLKQMKDESPHTKVVMVSAYNLFEYAQTAIRHGAYDYLLKPVDVEKIEDVLNRIEVELTAEIRQHSESEEMKQRLDLTSSAYRNSLLLTWMNGSLTAAERQELELLDWVHGSGIVIFSECRVEPGNKAGFDSTALLQQLEREWGQFGKASTFSLNVLQEDIFHAVTIISSSRLIIEAKSEIRRMVSSLGAALAKYGRLTHGVGGECRSLWMEAPQAYRAAQLANSYNFYDQWNGILFHDELVPAKEPFLLDGEKLFETLQGSNAEAAIEMCRAAFSRLAANNQANPSLMKECATLILMKLKSRLNEHTDRLIGSVITDSALNVIPSCTTYMNLMEVLESRIQDVFNAIKFRPDNSEHIVAECLRWIEENANEDLTLERTAEHFFFNASYFSTLIRSRTGRTFSDHVTDARMRRAKELLAQNRKIYEIAAECGYQDTKYFCRVFKKQHGMSPEAYKHASFSRRRDEG